MTVMDRIKGATEDADLFQAKRLFCTATALCRVSNIVLIEFRPCRERQDDRNGQSFFVSGGKHEI
jgi:hypothetical protein